ncbi:CBS domain-containing protein [Sphingobacterium sp. Mn56C]|uniref:CBS domain-containing protein n=1 Tax=Sphingobacterium sp. Mn56C TaxID=3395261 RepID=UPI003BD11E2D
MFIGQYISTGYYEILPKDSIDFAIHKMNDYHVKQLSVVEDGNFLGLIDEDLLLDQEEGEKDISTLNLHYKQVYLFDYQHIYDALQVMALYNYCFIPVLNKEHHYLGVLTKQDLLSSLNSTLGNDDGGAIIVLELGIHDNALSHIARIIEAENTSILSTAVHALPESSKLEMTIKVNKNNISAVVASLWRNNYTVKATFRDGSDSSDIQDRYDLLMNYLDL